MIRILKRSFVFIISLVLVFSITVPCFASDTSTGATGWNSWTLKEKTDYCCKVGVDIIASVTGIVHGDTSSYKEFLLDLYASNPKAGVDNFYEYLATGLSFDDDTQTWELSDDLVEFCNSVVVDYNDRVTMVYRHPVFKQHMLYENFPTKIVADNFYDLLEGLPDAYVSFLSTTIASYDQNNFILSSGETFSCNNRIRAIDLGLIIDGTSGVATNLDLEASSTTLYNDNWEVCKSYYVYLITPFDGTVDTSVYKYFYYSNSGKYVLCESFDDIVFSDCRYTTAPSRSTLLSSSYSCQMSTGFFFNGGSQALNVYKSVDDMKKDIGSQVIGSYTDTYTGTPVQTITQSEINNIINNYYPSDPGDDPGGGSGSGSGSDDSGGSSSGGFGIIDGLGKLFGAIGNIIDKLFGFVLGLLSKVVDFFGSILEMFTDTLTKLIDIVPTGFNEFLAAMFPYIPEEWITIAEFILLVSAIGCVVALFKR